MSAFPFNMFSPFSEAIGKFLYDPVTNWQGAFSPSIVFNANPQDAPIEAKAREIGISPRAGESWQQLKGRIQEKIS